LNPREPNYNIQKCTAAITLTRQVWRRPNLQLRLLTPAPILLQMLPHLPEELVHLAKKGPI
jgi:hypothetical protein